MSYSTVNTAIALVIIDEKIKLLEEFMHFLDGKKKLDDEQKEAFNDFTKSLKNSAKLVIKKNNKKALSDDETEKKKRQPSAFNLYIKDAMPIIKEKYPDIKDGKKLITLASESWNTDPKGLFIKKSIENLKKTNPNMNAEELYSSAKKLYEETLV